MPTPRGRGRQGRCATCNTFLHKWNDHPKCILCQVKSNQVCDPTSTCPQCAGWPDSTWTLYVSAVKEARARPSPGARRSLSFPTLTGIDIARNSHGFPRGFSGHDTGPHGTPAWPQSQPSFHPLPPQQEWYRHYLLSQLQALGPPGCPEVPPSDAVLELGIHDSGQLTPGQRSLNRSQESLESDLQDILPLHK